MARYIEATKCAEIISEKLGIRLFDLVDVFAEIPSEDVILRAEIDLLKSTITHKEEEAYNKGHEDGKADMQSKISILTVQNMALENTKSELQHELNKYKGVENILKDNMGELIMAAIVQAKKELASGILMDIKAIMEFIILDYKNIGSFDNAEIVGYVRDHLIAELGKRYAESIKKE